MKAGMAAFQAGATAWQHAVATAMNSPNRSDPAMPQNASSGADLFGDMFEPGIRLGEAYQREMEAILNRTRPSVGSG